jgi:ligand-binding sensor domain-containing protein
MSRTNANDCNVHITPAINIEDECIFARIGRRQGLPSNQVHEICEGARGLIWFATPNGLACYDGTEVRTHTQRDGLSSHGLRTVHADADGRVWVGTDVGLDVVEPSGEILPAVPGGEWHYGFTECIASTSARESLVGTQQGLVEVRHDSRHGAVTVSHRLLIAGLASHVLVTPTGRCWAHVASMGLVQLKDTNWQSIASPGWREAGNLRGIACAHEEHVIVFGDRGAVEIDADGKLVRRALLTQPPYGVSAALLDGDELLLAVDGALRGFRAIGRQWVLERELARDIQVNDLTFDRFGSIWIATESNGLLRASSLRHVLRRPRLPGTGAVYSVRPAGGADLLLGGQRMSWRVAGADMTRAAPIAQLAGQRVWDLVEDRQGALWAATDDGVSRCKPNEPLERFDLVSPVARAPTRCLLERADGIWLGTLLGLGRICGESVLPVEVRSGESLGYVYTLTEDRHQRLWIGTVGRGLWRESARGIARVATDAIPPQSNVYCVAFDPTSGRSAVLADRRIVLLDENDRAVVLAETESAVSGWTAHWSTDERLWVGSSSGLLEYDLRTRSLRRQIQAMFGIEGWEFVTSRSLSPQARGTQLVCGLNSGVAIVDVDRLSHTTHAPQITSVGIKWHGATPAQDSGAYMLTAGKWRMKATLHCPWFVDEDSLTFRHRLIGFNDDWTEVTRVPEIHYNALPPGDYELEAQAHSPLVGWGPVARVAQLRVEHKYALALRRVGRHL